MYDIIVISIIMILLLYRLSRYKCQYCDNDITFLILLYRHMYEHDKINGQTVILVHLLMFVVDSIS